MFLMRQGIIKQHKNSNSKLQLRVQSIEDSFSAQQVTGTFLQYVINFWIAPGNIEQE